MSPAIYHSEPTHRLIRSSKWPAAWVGLPIQSTHTYTSSPTWIPSIAVDPTRVCPHADIRLTRGVRLPIHFSTMDYTYDDRFFFLFFRGGSLYLVVSPLKVNMRCTPSLETVRVNRRDITGLVFESREECRNGRRVDGVRIRFESTLFFFALFLYPTSLKDWLANTDNHPFSRFYFFRQERESWWSVLLFGLFFPLVSVLCFRFSPGPGKRREEEKERRKIF